MCALFVLLTIKSSEKVSYEWNASSFFNKEVRKIEQQWEKEMYLT